MIPVVAPIVRTGLTVLTQGGARPGRVAMLVEDADGYIFALCPQRLAREAVDGRLFLTSGQEVGRALPQPPIEGPRTASDMLCLFRIGSEVQVDFRVASGGVQPARPNTVLDAPVYKLDDGSLPKAIVSCLDAEFKVAVGGRQFRVTDAIEIEPEDPETFARSDNAGALLIDELEQPLGVLIAGGGSRYYVAPLQPWLDEQNLRPLSAFAARTHNGSLRAPIFSIPSIEERNQEFADKLYRRKFFFQDIAVREDAIRAFPARAPGLISSARVG